MEEYTRIVDGVPEVQDALYVAVGDFDGDDYTIFGPFLTLKMARAELEYYTPPGYLRYAIVTLTEDGDINEIVEEK